MPLGGIGCGSIEIRPDGCFYEWNFLNNIPWGVGPRIKGADRFGLQFGFQVASDDYQLQGSLMDDYGCDPESQGWYWMADPYHLPSLRFPDAIGYEARFPSARLEYRFKNEPFELSLEAFSPFIPHDVEGSSFPGCILRFRFSNKQPTKCSFSLFGMLKNLCAYDLSGSSEILPFEDQVAGLLFNRPAPEGHPSAGTLCLAARSAGSGRPSHALHPKHGRDLWDPLRILGRLEDIDYTILDRVIGDVGREGAADEAQDRGALCMTVEVAPEDSVEIDFALAWHFPNLTEFDYEGFEGRLIGSAYALRFKDAAEAARRLLVEADCLHSRTRSFFDAFYGTDAPEWLLVAAGASLGILFRSAWLDRKGRFGVWEGIGSCGLQTIDVSHYGSFPILFLFPQLEASQIALTESIRDVEGRVPHMMPGNFQCGDIDEKDRIDLAPQHLLALHRLWRFSGTRYAPKPTSETVESILRIMDRNDRDGDGLPEHKGADLTYDQLQIVGISPFTGLLTIAATRAAAELLQEEQPQKASSLLQKADEMERRLDRLLWNGHWYGICMDMESSVRNEGCMTDQLNADAYWRFSTGEPLLKSNRVRKVLEGIYQSNRRSNGRSQWLINASWPEGMGIKVDRGASDQVNCPWTGVEFFVAAHMISCGLRRKGLQVAKDVFERYERAGMRFDPIECGHFYYRSMSSFCLYQEWTGLRSEEGGRFLSMRKKHGRTGLCFLPEGVLRLDVSEDGTWAISGIAGNVDPSGLEVAVRERGT
jgi:uncharacterized protein (DUF608 family)